MTKNLLKNLIIIFFLISSSALAEISYREILDNPTDLELNLNYAKQQEKAGNIKSTIATLERLSKLYPKNSDIKLYLISILLKMDSKVKVDFMVKTMLEDPNTNEETKKLIAELLTGNQFQKDKQNKWIAYLDINYSGNIALAFGSEKIGLSKKWKSNNANEICIKMKGKNDSFNLSVSVGIILSEVVRQTK